MTMEMKGASFLALACVGFIATAPAAAQTADKPEGEKKLGGMTVTATAIEEEIKVERVESPKATRALIDTPQTITVIGDQVLRKQNLLTLRDALQTIPGITFGAGEGGGGYGDSINLRGYSANNDITQDGVRDSAQYSRSETFNLQQIEVYNGANSVFNGSGSVGGTINLVTKTPQADDLTIVQGGIGTADYYRGTIDSNLRVSDLIAVRLNAVAHKNRVPGRDVERNKRWGIAPSVTIGIDSPTSLTLQYLHQDDSNVPVYGVPYFRNAVNSGPLPGYDPKDRNYYGIENLDDQDIVVDQLTMRFAHEFSDKVSVRNLTRWQRVEQDSSTSAPQGVYCLANGFQPLPATNIASTPLACPAAQNTPGTYYPSGPRGNIRNQENQLLYNQTDLRAVFDTAGLEHTLVVGVSLTKEDYELVSGNVLRTAAGATVAQPPISLAAPNTIYTGAVNFIQAGRSQGSSSNVAGYLFDTVKITPQLEFNAGLRYEQAKATFRADTFSTVVGPTLGAYTRGLDQRSNEKLFSYRVGLNFKPIETVSLYAAYGNSRTPTSATVRLGCGTLITAPAGSLDPCDVSPEKAVNYEIGAKADLFDRRLQLTAALFRNERTNYRVATNDPIVTTLQVTDGRSRVDGLALGASGNITEAWAIFANYTYLKSKVLQSVSNFCLANPGPRVDAGVTVNPCANSAAIPDPQAGQRLTNTPRHAGSLFTTYQFPFGLQLGYGLTYTGSFALNNSALASGTTLPAVSTLTPVFRSKSWLTHRAFLSYEVTDGVTAQVNVQNVTNKRYFTGIRNNGWATPGEARSAVFSLYYSF
ncbi:TonB-dependent receptor [Rhizorhabdus dicambivorans]|uniref:TonB-dependent siderophore receptor n=1 Tax=Rhizorhabdus dicambivorans TaxID=1850238 RepID=A0A2A4FZR0_9SPHN|nr:TonB-dependent receptor [Rhizorhabdus dicambivorans]ATE63046.1 TonB-dependent siderophore receptor [Rhizorhabdus dicambivorans]PCE43223.1 TonB-dependent siderophore receptor [Rhizorhabdus dicambivorans]